MRLELLVLDNWCQYKHREVTFHPGLNAFLGPNGAGKTNALNGILFALTGEYGRLAGNKADNICQLSESGQAGVRLVFVHRDMRFDVARALKGGQTNMAVSTLTGQKVEDVRGDTKVTKRLIELLGVRPEILADYVFVGQGEMFAPFDAAKKPSERAVAFQRLFGLDRLEQLWDSLGEQLSAMPVQTAPDVAPVELELTATRTQLQDLLHQRSGFTDIEGWQAAGDPDQQIVYTAQRAEAVAPSYAGNRESRKAALLQLRQTRFDIRTARHQASVLQRGIDEIQTKSLPAAELLITRAERAAQAALQRTRLAVQARSLDEQMANWQADTPVYPAHALTEMELVTTETSLREALAADRAYLQRLGNGTTCPTCGAPYDNEVAASRDTTASRIRSNDAALVNTQRFLAEVRHVTHQIEQHNRRGAQLDGQLQTVRATIAGLVVDAPVAAEDLKAAHTVRTNLASLQAARQQLVGRLTVLEGSLPARAAAVVQLRKVVQSARAVMAAAPAPDVLRSAQQRLQVKFERAQQLSGLVARLDETQRQVVQAETRLRQAQDFAAAVARSAAVRQRVNVVRDALHRDNLPKVLLQQRLAEVADDINQALALFSAQFRIEQEPEQLSYRANFVDGRQQSLPRLSGGEKGITALAFRIAINARFAKDLGLLCLDEPTAWFDADNVQCLDLALGRLREHARASGLQCVLITHEDVGHLFDHVTVFP